MKQKERWAALMLASFMTLSGCGGPAVRVTATPEPSATVTPTAPPVEELEFALPCYPGGGFHPITGTNRLNLTLAPLLYRGLFAIDRSFVPQKDLCADYGVSEDGLTWTFTLKETTFSNGAALTAAEVVSSLNAARQSDRYGGRLEDVIRVRAQGENKVEVTLSRPNGALPALLDVPIVRESEDPQRPLGTGPYYLDEGEEGLFLAAREGYKVPRQRVELRTVGSSDDLVYAFDTREISLVDTDLTGTNMPGYSGRQETTDYPTTGLLYVGCNTASGACREEAVRQAVALAFDREAMVRELLLGHAVASALPIHPYADGYDSERAGALTCDRERALELLTGAGWSADEEGKLIKRRNPLTLKLIVNQENVCKVAVAEALKDALEELGCTVSLTKLPWEDFVTALKRGQFDLYLGETILTADFDLEDLLAGGGALNYGGYADRETDRLLEEYRAASGEARKEAASALWTRLEETAPMVSLCFKNGSLLTQWGQVRGVAPTQRDVFAGLENWSVNGGE